ncbi:MAG: cyanophycin synthetase [Candidatus Azotimanducaceae bacterium]
MSTLEPIIEGRRLTGANFFCDEPAAILDIEIASEQFKVFFIEWKKTIEALHLLSGRDKPKIISREHALGQSLIVTAPIDALYSTIDLLEEVYLALLGNSFKALTEGALQTLSEKYKLVYKEEERDDIRKFQIEALKRKVPFLWDDDFLSLGYGKNSETWPLDQLPISPDWSSYKPMPLAIITGTNGKSTTTRLCSQILKKAGRTVGFSSTDGIWAGEECLDSGDYSGPGGAREVLRNKTVDVAILEVARGGLLRRGLGAENADISLITNVAEDHLGEYGVNTLDELIEAKFIIRKALKPNGTLILNADDVGCVKYAANLNEKIVWFSLDKKNRLIQSQIDRRLTAFYADKGSLIASRNGETAYICKIDDIPICFKGAAKHNISNALAASALCSHLGVNDQEIRDGLTSFDGNQQNPGRGNVFDHNGASIMVDFAHNPHGLNAVVDTLLQLPAQRRLVMFGHAGDRSNEDIHSLTKAALRLNPDLIIVYEMEQYLRGRKLGEIPAVINEALASLAYPLAQVIQVKNPIEGAARALDWSEKGDSLLLLTLADREAVITLLT